MSTATQAPRAARARAGVRVAWVAGIGIGGLLLSAVYRHAGLGVPCPFLALTGWQCPLCGGTRMGAALMGGDVAAAWAFNPVAFLGLAVLAVLAAAWALEWLGGPALRIPARVGARLAELPSPVTTLGWVVPLVAWTVLRNL